VERIISKVVPLLFACLENALFGTVESSRSVRRQSKPEVGEVPGTAGVATGLFPRAAGAVASSEGVKDLGGAIAQRKT